MYIYVALIKCIECVLLSSLENLHTRLDCTRVERDGFFESELHSFYNLRYVVNINMAEIDSDDENNIIQALKAMKDKPKADTPEVFMTRMDELVESKRAGKPPIPPKPVKFLFNNQEYLSLLEKTQGEN